MIIKKRYFTPLLLSIVLILACNRYYVRDVEVIPREKEPEGFSIAMCKAALERTKHQVRYDSRYVSIAYPGGDVPDETGVCSDVVIRSYRLLGIDLQKDVHEDMLKAFDLFPDRWGLKSPDTNIDHRRVPNLEVLFQRKGESLPVTENADDYLPGDIVTWVLSGRPHIGIVVNKKKGFRRRFMIVHNVGRGPVLEDKLFQYKINGHYRYYGTI